MLHKLQPFSRWYTYVTRCTWLARLALSWSFALGLCRTWPLYKFYVASLDPQCSHLRKFPYGHISVAKIEDLLRFSVQFCISLRIFIAQQLHNPKCRGCLDNRSSTFSKETVHWRFEDVKFVLNRKINKVSIQQNPVRWPKRIVMHEEQTRRLFWSDL